MTAQTIKQFAQLYGCNESEIQTDGIINPNLYASCSPKVLWVLKETWVHDSWKLMGSERAYDSVGSSGTYQPIAYVMHSILNGFISYDEMDFIRDNPAIFDSLRYIAYINAKKCLGGTRSDGSDVFHYYSLAKKLLIDQILEINPDIIIGCSPHFSDLLETIAGRSTIEHFNSLEWTTTESGKLLIHAYHPQQTTVSRKEYVDDIIQTVKRFTEHT